MKIRLLCEAAKELDEACLWYEEQVSGLGYSFLNAIDEAVDRIRLYPFSSEVAHDDLRKCSLKRFPFQIIYGLQEGMIVIVAVAHMKRLPVYWEDRWGGSQ